MSTLYELRHRPEAGSAVWSDWIDVGTSTSHKLTGLQPGTAYEVEVRAKGQTPAPLKASRWTRFAAPSAPTVSGVLAESATLTWAAVVGAAGYRVLQGGVPVSAVTFSESDGVVTAQVSGLTATSAQSFTVAVLNPDDDVSAPSSATATETLPLATGGDDVFDIDVSDVPYRVHKFTTVGTSTFTLNATRDVEYLVVAGGGGGSRGAGGGAGGLRTNVGGGGLSRAAGSYAVVVGSGGAGSILDAAGSDGGPSSAFGFTATGGGGGGARSSSTGTGRDGGSGGGGGAPGSLFTNDGGKGVSGQGSDGGRGISTDSALRGGGGGGAGGAGGNSGGGAGGAAGPGLSSDITGTSIGYAGGGAGNVLTSNAPGASAAAFGGGTGATTGDGGNGTDGRGGGGGGARSTSTGGSGGSGVVIVRYALSTSA